MTNTERIDFSQFNISDAADFVEMPEPEATFVESGETEYDEPSELFIDKKKRPPKAVAYEKKVKGILQTGFRMSITHPATVADGAALLMYGPKVAAATGDLAASNDAVAKAVDFLTEGNESPVAAMFVAVAPLVFQIIRNHEPILEPSPRGIRIPFTKDKRIKFKFGIKLGRLRNVTNDPAGLTEFVFTRPNIVAALKKNGIDVASKRGGRHS